MNKYETGAKYNMLNKQYNLEYIVGKKVNGKTKYITPGEEFKKILMERYKRN